MTHSRLADILDDVASQLIAGVEEAMSPTTVAAAATGAAGSGSASSSCAIVRAHGGTIDVRSGDDLTTFAVTLPRTASLTSVQ